MTSHSRYIVVTGANGFIGTNLVARLLGASAQEIGFEAKNKPIRFSQFEEDHQTDYLSVIASDMSISLNRSIAHRFHGSLRYHYEDYSNLIEYLKTQKEPPCAVVHNGACSSTTETDPAVFQHLNLEYSQKLWDYCAQYKVPYIYASSAATYGDGNHGFSDKKEDCHKYKALNLYGQSKLDFDLWTLQQKQTPPTWFGLRYFNVFGQFESHKGGQASMVFHGYNQAIQNKKIKLFKSNSPQYLDGEQVRDFIYIDDIVEMTMKLLKVAIKREHDSTFLKIPENGCFLNCGTGKTNSWNKLAQEVFQALHIPEQIEYIATPDNIKNQYQNYTCADLSTWKDLQLEHNCFSFTDAVQKYVLKHLLRGQ